MNASVLILAGWLVVPYGMALVAYLLEGPSDAQNAAPEDRAASR